MIINQVFNITNTYNRFSEQSDSDKIFPNIWAFEERIQAIGSLYFQFPAEIEKLDFFIRDEKNSKLRDLFFSKLKLRTTTLRYFIADFFDKAHFRFVPQDHQNIILHTIVKEAEGLGFSIKNMPDIYVSYEIPPKMLLYNYLFEEGNIVFLEESEDGELKEEKGLEYINSHVKNIGIEGFLGRYKPENQQILLYEKGIVDLTKREPRFKLSQYSIPHVVMDITLINMLARWIIHQAPGKKTAYWPLDDFILTSDEVHTMLSMLLTLWVILKIQEDTCYSIFTWRRFLDWLPSQYMVLMNLTDTPRENVFRAIEELRMLGRPATLDDLKALLPMDDKVKSEPDEETPNQ